ncbi:hypothetical protein HMPREF9406_0757 [Clostridium sp. HGF2]|nr:hypothetical protein HMPREF9406_0757 [Clostridium sp. HGF2]
MNLQVKELMGTAAGSTLKRVKLIAVTLCKPFILCYVCL